MDFYSALYKTLLLSTRNEYTHEENHDHIRYGRLEKTPVTLNRKILQGLRKLVGRRGYAVINEENFKPSNIDALDGHYRELENLYHMLSDDHSRNLLIQILAYRLLGYTRVKLPQNVPGYWEEVAKMEALADKEKSVRVSFLNLELFLINLESLGIPVKLYFTPLGAYIDFVVKQYEYRGPSKIIKADPGDQVLDIGACWGDTALYFANEAGPPGKVYSFEFIPSNLDLFRKNVQLNPLLENRIETIERPVGEKSGEWISYIDNGPGSRISFDQDEPADGRAQTISIDDFVNERSIKKIDFIKMDIEGAEPSALKGAVQTIRQHRPKLAIAIYHSLDDFGTIPEFINNLGLGYRFYLSHSTIHHEETILFAAS